MIKPRFRLFSGPNGSGKSTLIQTLREKYPLGTFINADEIEFLLGKQKYLDLNLYGKLNWGQNEWNEFLDWYLIQDKRAQQIDFSLLNIKEGILVWKNESNSYAASVIAAFIRFRLVNSGHSFSFETVMSHPSKVDFIKQAKEAGFKTYLYFICTEDPRINFQRVKNRTEMGGHDVPENLIEKRYLRSLELLSDAFLLADRAFVIDNSTNKRDLIIEKNNNRVEVYSEIIPGWVNHYLLDKLPL